MTWTKVGGDDLDAPDFVTLPRGVRLMHLEALVWCNRFGTDGKIPTHALRRLTDEDDIHLAAKMLTDIDLWRQVEDGWQIVDFLTNQPSADDVARTRALARSGSVGSGSTAAGTTRCATPKYCHQSASRMTHRLTARDFARESRHPYRSDPCRKG